MKARYVVSFVLELEQGPDAADDRSEQVTNTVGAVLGAELITQRERPMQSRVYQIGLLGACTWADFAHVRTHRAVQQP